MKIKSKNVLWLTCFAVCALFFLFSVHNLYSGVLITIFFLFFGWYCINIKENVYIALFMVAFFTFLLGRPIVKEILENDQLYYSVTIPQNIDNYTYVVMTISLISIVLGYCISKKIAKNTTHIYKSDKKNAAANLHVEYFSGILTIIATICLCFVNIENIIYVRSFGYLSSYLAHTSILPGFVTQIADMVPIIFSIYLATLPSKKHIRLPLLLYVLAMCLNLFAGRRYETVSSILLLILYANYRNKIDEEKWITKKHICLLLIVLPIVIFILILMETWRAGGKVGELNINLFIEFLNSVGSSSQIISYEKMYHDSLASRNVLFSFGNVWKSLNGNILANIFGISTVYDSQTIANALYGHSLSAAIMYKINPTRMLSGGGIGGCYIAELMCDFSYPGLIIGSLIIGIVLQKLNRLRRNHLVTNFLTIFMATALFRMPRDSFDYFFYPLLGIKSIILFVVIWAVYHKKRNGKVEDLNDANIN